MLQCVMEDNNYRTDFEHFLRESIEDFKMIPSRKIWYSIYNNMHPDRRWPSITVCFFILCSVLYVGVSNNNIISKNALANNQGIPTISNNFDNTNNTKENTKAFVQNIYKKTDLVLETKKADGILIETEKENAVYASLSTADIEINKSNHQNIVYAEKPATTELTKKYKNEVAILNEQENELLVKNDNIKNQLSPIEKIIEVATVVLADDDYTKELNNNNIVKKIASKTNIKISNAFVGINPNEVFSVENSELNNKIAIKNTPTTKRLPLTNNNEAATSLTISEKNKMDVNAKQKIAITNQVATIDDALKQEASSKNVLDIAVTNKQLVQKNEVNKINTTSKKVEMTKARQTGYAKFKEKSVISYYVTPSIGYRTLLAKQQNNKVYASNTNSFAGNTFDNTKGYKDVRALNMEAGFAIEYKIAKNTRFKTGLQANYTNYVSRVTEIGHPTQTTLALPTQQNSFQSSDYSTIEGGTNLNRSNFQIAIPIGVDFKILGNENIKWYVAASVQPTYVVSGNAYVLSTDENFYVAEKNFQRKFNINTAFETYLSFKTRTGVSFYVGPQIRYQLLNSYKKTYNYSEHLYNLGLKIGVSTTF
jgi:hypothetical protein